MINNDTLAGSGALVTLTFAALNSSTGADRMFVGLDNDTYTVDSMGDVIFEFAGEGTLHRVDSSVTNLVKITHTRDILLKMTKPAHVAGFACSTRFTMLHNKP